MKKLRILCIAIAAAATLTAAYMIGRFGQGEDNTFQSNSRPDRDKITLLAPYDGKVHQQILVDLAERFSLANETLVDVVFSDYEDFDKTVLLEYAKGSLPDMLIIDNGYMPALIDLEILCDITGFIEKKGFDRTMYNTLLDSTLSDGRYYGVPFTFFTHALYCNMNILSAYNISVPKTWDDLKIAAKRASTSGADGFGIPAKQSEEATNQFLQLVYSTGAGLNSLGEKEGRRAFELLEYMVKDGTLAKECINWSQRDLTLKFARGEVAMMLNSSSQAVVLEDEKPDFVWEVSFMPVDRERRCVVTGESIGITKAEGYASCIEFLEFAYNEENIEKVTADFGGIPPRVDISSDAGENGSEYKRIFYEEMKNPVSKGFHRLWADISKSIQNGLFSLLTQEETAAKCADRVQTLITEYILSE